MAKRAFDVLVSICAIVLLSPLLIALAAWVKIDSKGSALFRQTRVGRHGVPFEILKFRTMRADASAEGPQITVGNDSRITRAGAILRRYKLDELPQFFNVLRGEMSVVGPRPEVPRYVALYTERQKAAVLSMRPGITDAASLAFRNESELLAKADDPESFYTQVILPAKLAQAEAYVATHSLGGDIRIVLRTVAMLAAR
ncbi:lipopolysaccharide/colanic/teichoic acid biosynthesis glycosyltransferase [Variovorax sp. OAS795]|uniref:sugar transferase n=1 Tax=Variovorax sp. OAS795 TaxID=3034231 RepID=UPI003390D49C